MSLYNAILGYNPQAAFVLRVLGMEPGDVVRFRDAWVGEDGHLHVFTRLGGGNRECWCDSDDHICYTATIAGLQEHSLYVRDFDDDFDGTYATFVFRVPDDASPEDRATIAQLAAIPRASFRGTAA